MFSVKLTTFKSILHLSGPVGVLSADDITALKDAVSKKLNTKSPSTGIKYYQQVIKLFNYISLQKLARFIMSKCMSYLIMPKVCFDPA